MAFNPNQPSGFSGPPNNNSGGFRPPRGGRSFGPPPSKDEHRVNERIRVPEVRLIDDLGNQVGVVPTYQALQMARDKGLDLMEVSPNSRPPVCKILDYGKFKYEKKKKEHEAKKKQTVIKVKEMQLRPRTDEHDLEYKTKNMREFLEDGDKVKIVMMFRGREIAYVDDGHRMMRELAEKLKDISTIEYEPKAEGKKLIMILAPVAGAPKKKAPAAPGVQESKPQK